MHIGRIEVKTLEQLYMKVGIEGDKKGEEIVKKRKL